jgi:hypothetical protein
MTLKRGNLLSFVTSSLLMWSALSQSLLAATLVAVDETGPRGARINLVILSEGYTVADMPNFATHVSNAVAYLFSREPWKQYRSYFNIYRIEAPSNQSGTDYGSEGVLKDTYFQSGFVTAGVPQLLTLTSAGQSLVYSTLNTFVPEYDIPIVLVNDTKYGGAGGAISVASVHSSSAMIAEHEVGHSFASLADEYDTYYASYTPQESYNATQQTNLNTVRWRSWIVTNTPILTPETPAYNDVVGVFEGAMYRTNGWYRPHNNSLMRSLGRPPGSVNREKFVLSYYQRIPPVESYVPAALTQSVTNLQELSFTVNPMIPSEGPRLIIQWYVDNVVQSETNGTLSIVSDQLGNGAHTVAATVRDNTLFVRDDPSGVLRQIVRWRVSLANQLPATLAAWRAAYGPDGANPSGDGLNNIGKYALGLDPTKVAFPAERPFASITEVSPEEHYLTLNIPRKVKRASIHYFVGSSSGLATWNSGAGYTVLMEDSSTLLKVRDAVPGGDPRFLDFRVSEQ